MPDTIGATPPQGDQPAPEADATAPSSPEQATASPQDEYAKLLSRIAGLDAKVTSLKSETDAQRQAREAAEKKLADYEAGKVNADEALRAQLEAKERELEQTRREVAIAKVAQAYPETFGVFGEAVVGMSPDQLAAAEARFAGNTGARGAPGANPPRQQGGTKDPNQMSLAELREALATAPVAGGFSTAPMRDWK